MPDVHRSRKGQDHLFELVKSLYQSIVGMFVMRVENGFTCHKCHYSLVSQCGISREIRVRKVHREDNYGIRDLLR